MKSPIVVGAVLVASAVVGAVLSIVASPAKPSPAAAGAPPAATQSSSAASQSSGAAAQYPVNTNGQTYGSGEYAKSDSDLPDLILVRLSDGREGYILKKDYIGPSLSLDQVKALPTDSNGNFVQQATTVPVYAQDGTTQIGTFTMQAGQSVNTP